MHFRLFLTIFFSLAVSCSSPQNSELFVAPIKNVQIDPNNLSVATVTCVDGSVHVVPYDKVQSACASKPTKTYKKVAANSNGMFCAIDTKNELFCENFAGSSASDNGLEIPPYLGKVKDVAISESMACVIKDTPHSEVECWGTDLGDAIQSMGPYGFYDSVKIAVSRYRVCAVSSSGSLSCYGENKGFSAGFNPYAHQPLEGDSIVDISGGDIGFCVTYMSGINHCWVPGGIHDFGRGAVSVNGDGRANCALYDDGRTFCQGANERSLGYGSSLPAGSPHIGGKPSHIAVYNNNSQRLEDSAIVGPAESESVACVSYSDRYPYCFGSNASSRNTLPRSLGVTKSMALSRDYACALTVDDGLSCWKYGQENLFDFQGVSAPVRFLVAGANTTCAAGRVEDENPVHAPSGTYASCFGEAIIDGGMWVLDNGKNRENLFIGYDRYCFMSNGYLSCIGKRISGLPELYQRGGLDMKSLKGGKDFTCALMQDGVVNCWGQYENASPGTMNSATDVKILAAGENHACVIKNDDSVQCWGSDQKGETRVPDGLRAKSIALGRNFSCALTSDKGKLECWGDSGIGHDKSRENIDLLAASADFICLGSKEQNLECLAKAGNEDLLVLQYPRGTGSLKQIVTGYRHACAVRESDSTSVCWGDNAHGQTRVPNQVADKKVDYSDARLYNEFESFSSIRTAIRCDQVPQRATYCKIMSSPIFSFAGFNYQDPANTQAVVNHDYKVELNYSLSCPLPDGEKLSIVDKYGRSFDLESDSGTAVFENQFGSSNFYLRKRTNGYQRDLSLIIGDSHCSFSVYSTVITPTEWSLRTAADNAYAFVKGIRETYNKSQKALEDQNELIQAVNLDLDGTTRSINEISTNLLRLLTAYPGIVNNLGEGKSIPVVNANVILTDISLEVKKEGDATGTYRVLKPKVNSIIRNAIEDVRFMDLCSGERICALSLRDQLAEIRTRIDNVGSDVAQGNTALGKLIEKKKAIVNEINGALEALINGGQRLLSVATYMQDKLNAQTAEIIGTLPCLKVSSECKTDPMMSTYVSDGSMSPFVNGGSGSTP